MLKGKGKVRYVTGDASKHDSSDPKFSTWDAENSIVMAWIINSMEPRIGRTYLFYKTTHEILKVVQVKLGKYLTML